MVFPFYIRRVFFKLLTKFLSIFQTLCGMGNEGKPISSVRSLVYGYDIHLRGKLQLKENAKVHVIGYILGCLMTSFRIQSLFSVSKYRMFINGFI
jgi:hypothetical protein